MIHSATVQTLPGPLLLSKKFVPAARACLHKSFQNLKGSLAYMTNLQASLHLLLYS